MGRRHEFHRAWSSGGCAALHDDAPYYLRLNVGWELHGEIALLKGIGKALHIVVAIYELHLLNFAGRHQEKEFCLALPRLFQGNRAQLLQFRARVCQAAIDILHAQSFEPDARIGSRCLGDQREEIVANRFVALATLFVNLGEMLSFVTSAGS